MNTLLVILALVVIVLVILAVNQAAAEQRSRQRFLPPGRLVDVGGYRLHLNDHGRRQARPNCHSGGRDGLVLIQLGMDTA